MGALLGMLLIVGALFAWVRGAGRRFPERWLAAGLAGWLLVYLFTKTVGIFNYSGGAFFVFALAAAPLIVLAERLQRRALGTRAPAARAGGAGPSPPAPPLLPLAICGLLLAGWLALALLEGLLFAPRGSPDAFSYHLPTVNSWVAWGNTAIQQNLDYRFANWPHAVHSLYGWLALVSGTNRYLGLVNLLFGAVLWPFAIFYTLRALRFRADHCVLFALLGSVNTVWFAQASAVSTDLVLAALLVLAIGVLLRLAARAEPGRVLLLAMTLALLAATKVVGMVFASLLLLVGAVLVFRRRRDFAGGGAVWASLVVLLLLVFGLGGITYWRNLWVFGNPVYPAEVNFLPGLFASPAATHLIDWYYETTPLAALWWVLSVPVRYFMVTPMAWSPLYNAVFVSLLPLALLAAVFRGRRHKPGAASGQGAMGAMDAMGTRATLPPAWRAGAAVLLSLLVLAVLYRLIYVNPPAINRYLYFLIFGLALGSAWVTALQPARLQRAIVGLLLVLIPLQMFQIWSARSELVPAPRKALTQQQEEQALVRSAEALLADGPVLVVRQGNVQLPYPVIASLTRKVFVAMAHGPAYTDIDTSLLVSPARESASERGRRAKGNEDERRLRALARGESFRNALVEKHCITRIVSTVGDIPAPLLPPGFDRLGMLGDAIVYRGAPACGKTGPQQGDGE